MFAAIKLKSKPLLSDDVTWVDIIIYSCVVTELTQVKPILAY